HVSIAQVYPDRASWMVSLGFIFMSLVYLNVVLGVLDLIINSCSFFMVIAVERSSYFQAYNNYVVILVPILLIILFSGILKLLVVNFISYSGALIAHLFGMI